MFHHIHDPGVGDRGGSPNTMRSAPPASDPSTRFRQKRSPLAPVHPIFAQFFEGVDVRVHHARTHGFDYPSALPPVPACHPSGGLSVVAPWEDTRHLAANGFRGEFESLPRTSDTKKCWMFLPRT